MVPGITGWAQVNGRDDLEIPEKVQFDAEYMQSQSMRLELKILAATFFKVLRADGVQH
jgi:O-antigen biosynthesis protein WbqP